MRLDESDTVGVSSALNVKVSVMFWMELTVPERRTVLVAFVVALPLTTPEVVASVV